MTHQFTTFAPIADLRALLFVGDDAGSFLQGQLTAEIAALPLHRWVRTAYCSRQGRIMTCMLVGRGTAGYAALLPAAAADDTIAQLAKFILRAKVKITALEVVEGRRTADLAASDKGSGDVQEEEGALIFSDGAWQLKALLDGTATVADDVSAVWRREQIMRGAPWAGGATSGMFIPQHINLELWGGVNFKKGCYVGQEVIARLHYLGKIKRRGYIVSGRGVPPAAGQKIGEGIEVVNAAPNDADGFVCFASLPCAAATVPQTWQGEPLVISPPPEVALDSSGGQ